MKKNFVLVTSKSYYKDLSFLPNCLAVIDKKEDLTFDALTRLKPDIVFFPHWSYIISEDIHNNFECVIFHMTDVPYGRGGSPLQNLIVRGHKDTTLTALKCVKELDAGPVYLQKPLSLEGSAQEIFMRARDIIKDMLEEIIDNNIYPVQQEGEVVLFERRTKKDSDIFNLSDMSTIYDYIRMLDAEGYPHAFIETNHGIKYEFTNVCIDGEYDLVAQVRIKKNG